MNFIKSFECYLFKIYLIELCTRTFVS